jgi:uncharacterized tellurite resistance protein B-like protein
MKETLRPALVRWLTDLMKADKIIATGEIEYLEQMCQEFSISQFDIEKALGLSLAESCNMLSKHLNPKERNKIIKKLKALSLSDGACAREEALLLMALSYCLGEETREHSQMVSFKSAHIDFVDSQVLFIEPNADITINGYIRDNIKPLINEFRIGGFDFIYIPRIAEHYKHTNRTLLCKIIKYLAPTLSDNETHNVLEVISNMTTRYFKNEILKAKLNISLPVKKPSLLIKIGNSYVNGEMMSDFLVLEAEEDIVSQVSKMIETFIEFQRCPTITIKNYTDAGGDFVYTGFYKTIFDLVTYRKGARCSLVINPDKRKGRLEILSDIPSYLEMGLGETAFYVFLIMESLSRRKGVTFRNQGAKSLREIQTRYEKIYGSFVGSRDDAPNITDSNTRNRMLSKIREAISKNDFLTEKQVYLPNTDTNKIFVAIEPQLIFIKEGKNNSPLLESNNWKWE